MTIHHGDCLDVMAGMEPESVDAIVTDPPYGLEFMGKEWDKLWDKRANTEYRRKGFGATALSAPNYRAGRPAQEFHARWAEAALRVAKPSAYLLAFGGTRTVHRMTCALEDAGWIIRDMLVWAYASGFPKSKASLKPAWEPIVMARKPGPLRMLAIDACRIPGAAQRWTEPRGMGFSGGTDHGPNPSEATEGRWPANVLLTDPIFDGGVEGVVGGGEQSSTAVPGAWAPRGAFPIDNPTPTIYGDSGTYSRFFLIPKADRADREPVLGGLEPQAAMIPGTGTQKQCGFCGERWIEAGLPRCGHGRERMVYVPQVNKPRQNVHPTVKPVDLMRHLVRLVTPLGGIVLDPFLGSGTTAIAAEMEGFAWIGIEREAEYVAIAEARLNGTQKGLGLVV